MSHHTWNYQHALRAAGYRVTPQRELIMDVVCAHHGRVSARDVLEVGRARGAALDAATVYRNLRFLADRGLVRAIVTAGVTTYELAGPGAAHHHLVCRVCGAETEIDDRLAEPFYAAVEASSGFRVRSRHLTLEGTCATCSEREVRDGLQPVGTAR